MTRLPAEWEPHEATLIALPHLSTDWSPYLEEILNAYVVFVNTIAQFEPVIGLCANLKNTQERFGKHPNIKWIEAGYNDTWIRDYGPIDCITSSGLKAYDFTFNAWGGKFQSNKDNEINRFLNNNETLKGEMESIDFILEGGSIESSGDGTLLTTTKCLLNKNRNAHLSKEAIEEKIKNLFGLKQIWWLENGHLEGDDTDAHIDTLARFIANDTIAYVTCKDKNDSHYEPLKLMEEELKSLHVKLIPLPLPKPIYYDVERLPATYANFVFVNGGLIVPTYDQPSDAIALQTLQNALPHLRIVGVDASVFIRQHGSLHCACMHRIQR